MPLIIFAFLLLVFGPVTAVQAHDDSTTYNIKNAPKAQKAKPLEEDEIEAEEDEGASKILAPPEQDLSTAQKEEIERRKITGEGSDVFHGDENSWPHSGRMH